MPINARATQAFVSIKEVRDGIVILKNGELRAVLLASSINLSLKSAEEQKATIMEFQSFLNTLDFSIQICIQSRRLDIRPYLILLENRMKDQEEPLIKIQTREYIEFIKNFTEQVNIMTKSFFIVIPYSAEAARKSSFFSSFFGGGGQSVGNKTKEEEFEEKRIQLEQRMGVIEQGLSRVGVRVVQLGTEEIVELYYKVFNPGEIGGIRVSQ